LRGFDLKKNLTEINHKVGLLAKWVFRLFSDLKAWRTEQCHPERPGQSRDAFLGPAGARPMAERLWSTTEEIMATQAYRNYRGHGKRDAGSSGVQTMRHLSAN
jgi:hypothetical protein